MLVSISVVTGMGQDAPPVAATANASLTVAIDSSLSRSLQLGANDDDSLPQGVSCCCAPRCQLALFTCQQLPVADHCSHCRRPRCMGNFMSLYLQLMHQRLLGPMADGSRFARRSASHETACSATWNRGMCALCIHGSLCNSSPRAEWHRQKRLQRDRKPAFPSSLRTSGCSHAPVREATDLRTSRKRPFSYDVRFFLLRQWYSFPRTPSEKHDCDGAPFLLVVAGYQGNVYVGLVFVVGAVGLSLLAGIMTSFCMRDGVVFSSPGCLVAVYPTIAVFFNLLAVQDYRDVGNTPLFQIVALSILAAVVLNLVATCYFWNKDFPNQRKTDWVFRRWTDKHRCESLILAFLAGLTNVGCLKLLYSRVLRMYPCSPDFKPPDGFLPPGDPDDPKPGVNFVNPPDAEGDSVQPHMVDASGRALDSHHLDSRIPPYATFRLDLLQIAPYLALCVPPLVAAAILEASRTWAVTNPLITVGVIGVNALGVLFLLQLLSDVVTLPGGRRFQRRVRFRAMQMGSRAPMPRAAAMPAIDDDDRDEEAAAVYGMGDAKDAMEGASTASPTTKQTTENRRSTMAKTAGGSTLHLSSSKGRSTPVVRGSTPATSKRASRSTRRTAAETATGQAQEEEEEETQPAASGAIPGKQARQKKGLFARLFGGTPRYGEVEPETGEERDEHNMRRVAELEGRTLGAGSRPDPRPTGEERNLEDRLEVIEETESPTETVPGGGIVRGPRRKVMPVMDAPTTEALQMRGRRRSAYDESKETNPFHPLHNTTQPERGGGGARPQGWDPVRNALRQGRDPSDSLPVRGPGRPGSSKGPTGLDPALALAATASRKDRGGTGESPNRAAIQVERSMVAQERALRNMQEQRGQRMRRGREDDEDSLD